LQAAELSAKRLLLPGDGLPQAVLAGHCGVFVAVWGQDLSAVDFEGRLTAAGKAVENTLAELLASNPIAGEIARPERLIEAMRYATLAGGKRLRPFLTVEAAGLFGVEGQGVLRAAASVEFVHCYSLVHDDLPAMDDDDLRRGRPTTHRAFDEATAILVGDTLLTLAFDVLADEKTEPDPEVRVGLVGALARASGIGGMAGGQMLDLEAEGRFTADGKPLALGDMEILRLQAMKTGALLNAAVEMGAIIGRADRTAREALRSYGHMLGQAFQIADDLLDVEADAATIGKATGKDQEMGKATLIGLWGVEAARHRLSGLVAEAEKALSPFGDKADVLRHAARFVAERKR
jgi:farnesyl diphosphate synthase